MAGAAFRGGAAAAEPQLNMTAVARAAKARMVVLPQGSAMPDEEAAPKPKHRLMWRAYPRPGVP
jgi:hypothetical protein